jgi:thiol-disulfide isomerase/thioredoxin
MHKKLLIALIMLISFTSMAQSAYDSLKNVYHAQYIFEQREKGDSFKFIKEELNSIKNPELKQFAACAIASNIYGYGFVDNKKVLSLVEDVITSPQSEATKSVAVQTKEELTRSLIGTKIQSISLPSPGGDTVKLTDYYGSKFDFVIVDLWATWCGPCIAEMKKFNDLRKQYNVEFYSISLDDDISKVQKFVKRNPDYSWPIVFAGGKGSPLWDYFKARLIPAFVIVDKDGIVVSHIVGNGLENELKKLYKK